MIEVALLIHYTNTMRSRKQRKAESKRTAKHIVLIFGLITILCALYFVGGYAPMETAYRYEIKAEQVYDSGEINESVELQNLSQDEQQLLHDAFKDSDEFLGDAEVTVKRQERFDTFDGWRVVEFQGVYILVAIDGPEVVERFGSIVPWIVVLVLLFASALTIVGVIEYVNPSPY
jgi:hypothetical protein